MKLARPNRPFSVLVRTSELSRSMGHGIFLPLVVLGLFFFDPPDPRANTQTSFSPSAQIDPLQNFPEDARSQAMGSALVGLADGPSALFYNPSGLGALRDGQMALDSHLWLDGTFQESLWLSLSMTEKDTLGIGIQYLDFGTMEGRDSAGSLSGTYGADRIGFGLGWGSKLLPELCFGAALEGIQDDLAGTSQLRVLSDLGFLWRPHGPFQLGIAWTNLGWGPGGTGAGTFHAGGVYATAVNDRSLVRFALADELELGAADLLKAGLEYELDGMFFLRAGYQQYLQDNDLGGLNGPTAGIGFRLDGFTLDYAFAPYGDLGDSHRITLGYPFGDTAAEKGGRDPVLPGATPGRSPSSMTGPRSTGKNDIQTSGRPGTDPGPKTRTGPAEDGVSPDAGTKKGISIPKPAGASGGAKDDLVLQFDLPDDQTGEGGDGAQGRTIPTELGMAREKVLTSPKDPDLWWALGTVYYRMKQKENAVYCFEKALLLAPDRKKWSDWLEKYKSGKF